MTQTSIFDAIAATEAKERGIARASKNPLLPIAQEIAVEIGKRQAIVNADHVQAALILRGYPEGQLKNSAGALFPKKLWKWVGYTRSKRVIGHGNVISEWQLKALVSSREQR